MNKDWDYKSFEDCIENVNYPNKIQRNSFLEIGDFPIISQEKKLINGYWNNQKDLFKISKPVIVFGDHTKIIKYVDFDFVLGADGVKILQPIKDLIPKFLYHFLCSIKLRDLGYSRHFRLLREFSIPLPPFPEQQRIVEILDQSFAAIDQAIANTEKNLQNAREILNSYMVNLFSNPKPDWIQRKLDEICIVERGSSPRPIEKFLTNDENGKNWIKIGDTKNVEKYIFSTKEKITIDGSKKSRHVKSGDFILSNSMSFGKPFIMKTDGYIHDGWFVLRLEKNLDPEYFWYLLSSRIVIDQFNTLASGAIVKNISSVLVKKVILPIPPEYDQKKIVEELNNLSSKIKVLESHYNRKLQLLAELKQSILQKAFNGELT